MPALTEAVDQEERASYILFQLDNDIFTGSDRGYTNGARFAYLHPISKESMNRAQHWLQELSGAEGNSVFGNLISFVDPEGIEYDWGMGLTQLMFTPADYTATVSPPGQRPYASWLGAEFSLHAKDANALSSVIFSIGITGKDTQGQETQNWVHRNISNSPIFQGWDSQVAAEVTLNLNFDRKQRLDWLAEMAEDWTLDVDGYFEWGAGIGNFRTDAYLGTLMRIGFNLPTQYMTPRIQLGAYSHELFVSEGSSASGWSLYGFGGARGTAVAHDITMDGPWFRDFDESVASEDFVGEFLVGFGLRYERLTFTFSRTFRSKEFSGQASGHQFGSVLVSLGF